MSARATVVTALGVLAGAGLVYFLAERSEALADAPKELPPPPTPEPDPGGELKWQVEAPDSKAAATDTPPVAATTSSDFVKKFMLMHEGRKKKVYLDTAGNPIRTIGIGHVICQLTRDTLGFWPDASSPPLTLKQIDDLYAANVAYFDKQIAKNIKVDLNQNQYDALMDLLWNTGESPITTGKLKPLLNAGKFDEAAALIGSDQWAYKQGVKTPSPYLQRLRNFEADLFRTPVDRDVSVTLNDFVLKGGNGVVKKWSVPVAAKNSSTWDYYDPAENVPPPAAP
jgi:lysozyme